jgi:hypothetical protein
MAYESEGMPERNPAADRANLPGTFLLIVGALNIIGSLYLLYNGVQVMMLTPEQRQQAEQELQENPEQRERLKELEKQGFSLEKLFNMISGFGLTWGGLALVAGIVTLIGGLQMRSLHSYGLAVTAAVLAIIPCLSPAGCFGLGEAIGIWALIVLMNSDVKSAFR